MNRSCFFYRATLHAPDNPCDTPFPSCAEGVLHCTVFSLVRALPSTRSAASGSCSVAWFARFIGTAAQSDSSLTFVLALRPWSFPAGLDLPLPVVKEVSRFSCMHFLCVPGVEDYVGSVANLR